MDRKYLNLGIVIVLVILVFFGVKVLYNNLSEEHIDNSVPEITPEVNQEGAPDFTVYSLDGEKVSLASFKGKPVVINFWATWCGYCVEEFPHFENAWKKYGDEVEFMMIDLTDGQYETEESAKEFIREMGYTFPVYFDLDADAATKNATSSIPVTVFIDADGNLVNRRVGAMNEEMLFSYIDNLIGE